MMHRAGELRKSPTLTEAKLWIYLLGNKVSGASFRRQHAIGRYVVDLCSPKHRLTIELDGRPNLGQKERDFERTAELKALGYRVLKFRSHQVANDMDGVMDTIIDALRSS